MPEDSKNLKVGHQLKSRRQALRLSLAQVEIDTKIRGKFLTALESGDYSTLPNDIYSRGFVQNYANHLGLNGTEVAAAYVLERGGVSEANTKRPKLEKTKRLVFTGRLITIFVLLSVAISVIWYLLWQFSALAAPPSLTITSPDSDMVQAGADITLAGHSTPGTDVSVNDSPILSDTDGNFSEKIALEDGVNAIKVSAHSKLGKSTTVVRNVLAKLPKVDPAQAVVPLAVFTGVAVAVTVKETTSIVVSVDGAEQFRGTFVMGKSQVFSGKNDVNITTGNAGATSLIITNSVVVGKKLNPLGSEGEIRRNQDFSTTTVIP